MKKGPVIVLASLSVIILFAAGVKYGTMVERTNKAVDYLQKLVPSPSKAPTPSVPKITFETAKIAKCGVTFTYPTTATLIAASDSATLTEGTETVASINCVATVSAALSPKVGTASATPFPFLFKNQQIIGQYNSETYTFVFTHPTTGKKISAVILKRYYPLFDQSLQFVPISK